MARILSLVALLLPAFLVRPAWTTPPRPPSDQVLLRFDLEKGPPFFQELDIVNKQSMQVMGQDLMDEGRRRFIFEWTPKGKDGQGNWLVGFKVVGVKTTNEFGGNRAEFDSENPRAKPNPNLNYLCQKLMNLEAVFTLDSNNQVIAMDKREHLLHEHAKVGVAFPWHLDKLLSDDKLKIIPSDTFEPLPNRSVRKSETWSRISTLDFGPLGIYHTKSLYHYIGRIGELDKISVTSEFKYEKPDKAEGSFIIKNADLKNTKGEGEVFYDRTQGRIVSSTMTTKLQGIVTVEIAGTDATVTVDITHTVRSKFTDHNPWRKNR